MQRGSRRWLNPFLADHVILTIGADRTAVM
jgi:hypothetical protein